MPRDFLLVIGEREPLAWILTHGRMAFPTHRAKDVASIAKGDRFFLYTTRGCFHNPARDRGRVIGEALVTTAIRPLKVPVVFGGRSFPLGCSLRVIGLAPIGEGLDLSTMVSTLNLLPSSNPQAWGTRLRKVLVPVDRTDSLVLHERLTEVMKPMVEVVAGYLKHTAFAHDDRE